MRPDYRLAPTVHWSSREGERIKYLVLHGANAPVGGSLEKTKNFLVGPNARQVSSHELVGEEGGRPVVWTLLDETRAAHTVGFSRMPDGATGIWANRRSYNIEAQHIAGQPMSALTYALLIFRAATKCIEWKWQPAQIIAPTPARAVLGHYEVDTQGKTCPGLSMYQRMDAVRREIAGAVDDLLGNRPHEIAVGPGVNAVIQRANGEARSSEIYVAQRTPSGAIEIPRRQLSLTDGGSAGLVLWFEESGNVRRLATEA